MFGPLISRVRRTLPLGASFGNELLGAVGRGCKGGLVATVVLTVSRILVFRLLPPTDEFWALYVGGDAEQYFVPGLVLHSLYGLSLGTYVAVGEPVGDVYRKSRQMESGR